MKKYLLSLLLVVPMATVAMDGHGAAATDEPGIRAATVLALAKSTASLALAAGKINYQADLRRPIDALFVKVQDASSLPETDAGKLIVDLDAQTKTERQRYVDLLEGARREKELRGVRKWQRREERERQWQEECDLFSSDDSW